MQADNQPKISNRWFRKLVKAQFEPNEAIGGAGFNPVKARDFLATNRFGRVAYCVLIFGAGAIFVVAPLFILSAMLRATSWHWYNDVLAISFCLFSLFIVLLHLAGLRWALAHFRAPRTK